MDDRMADFLGLNRAVPNASLLKRDDESSLGFETTSWQHLNRYVGAVESAPPEIDDSSAASGRALARVRTVAKDFGSPARLRQLVNDQPEALTADRPPGTLYASVAWVVAHLHRSASSIVSTLRDLPSEGKSSGDVKMALRQLGGDAENARKAIGPMVEALKRFKASIVEANAALAAAYKADADELQQFQEDEGRSDVKAAALQKESADLGLFSAGRKRAVAADLQALHQHQTETSNRAQALRAVLAAVEPILNEGFWLETGVDDMVDFLDKLRQVLTTFGSGMTQIAADGSDAQLQDLAGIGKALGGEAALERWSAIERAAGRFVGQAMVDVAAPVAAAGAGS
jgi:hypothetical protein